MLLSRVMGRNYERYVQGLDLFDSDSAWRLGGWIPLQVLSGQQLTAAVNSGSQKIYAFRYDPSRLFTVTSS